MVFHDVDYYDLDALLTEEEKMVRRSVRDFMQSEVAPLVTAAYHREEPLDVRSLASRMGELGLIGSFIPSEHGAAASQVTYGLISQEMDRVDSAVGTFMGVQSGLVMNPIWRFGSAEQKRKWLPQIAAGRAVGCFGLTEPDHGSDVTSMQTTARKDGAGWVINGAKQWISEGSVADVAVVWARTGEGIRGFLVERGTPGFTQTMIRRKGSMRASDVGELGFSDCRLGPGSMLPDARGIGAPLTCLNQCRYGVSWGAIGIATDCYELALSYTLERRQFGAPIASFQVVQEKLVAMLMGITTAQLFSYRLGRLMDEGKARPAQMAMAKKNNLTMARACTRTARELLGANGISLDFSPIRHMANVESLYTYDGTNDMQTLVIGADITGISAVRHTTDGASSKQRSA